MKYLEEFRDPGAAACLKKGIEDLAGRLPQEDCIRIMEVCGTHTMAIGRYGIRSILPSNIDLISGPGCPVCVTETGYIDAAIELSRRGLHIATFGDMLKVPGSATSLAQARAEGASVTVCYSPAEALEIAELQPQKQVVFLAVGFETTVAPITAVIDRAARASLQNISFLIAFKQVLPALNCLADQPDIKINAFLLPPHVSAIIGSAVYEPVVNRHRTPAIVAGFEPLDILLALEGILKQLLSGQACVENQYKRAVKESGNEIAQRLIARYLEPSAAHWRGLGEIPASGLKLRADFAAFDAEKKFDLQVRPGKINPACRCGEVLKGVMKPPSCALFAKACTPQSPIGPCMVSSEGSCAAYFKYNR